MSNPIIIIDLDGTMCNISHRVHHVEGMTPDWDAFFADIDKDPPHDWCKKLCNTYEFNCYDIYLVSGRPSRYREVTEKWLEKHDIHYTCLFMRLEGDRRADDIVKREILHSSIPKERVEFVVDDRESVVKMWREEGLICLQCNATS